MLDSELNDKEPGSEGYEPHGTVGIADTTQGGEQAAAPRRTVRRTRRATRAASPGTEEPAGSTESAASAAPAAPPAPFGTPASEPAAAPAASVQPPQVIFQPPAATASPPPPPPQPSAAQPGNDERDSDDGSGDDGTETGSKRRRRRSRSRSRGGDGDQAAASADHPAENDGGKVDGGKAESGKAGSGKASGGTAGGGKASGGKAGGDAAEPTAAKAPAAEVAAESPGDDEDDSSGSRRRRRKRRRGSGAESDQSAHDDPPNTVVHVRQPRAGEPASEVQAVRGSTRLEAKRQRRKEGRESGRRRQPIITESEFLARREAVERVMVVRQRGDRTQIAVLEDGVLVEHYVDRASHQSLIGNVYLGKVQNVLPSMEAAFVDIGKGRNAVLYAGEVNFDASGLEGDSKRIESALKSGQSVLVQVTKDPVGHKGARLTSQVSLPGRYLVYVPNGSMMGISRKLPDSERSRLKQILKQVMPEDAGVIVRTAAEGASEEELAHDVSRLSAQWESIKRKSGTASAPHLLYSEPDLTIRVVRDIFNEDFSKLVVEGDEGWDLVDEYVRYVAPHLAGRLEHWQSQSGAYAHYRVDEQLAKALERKVWLPSGGSLVIDNTEAMTVVDVNTGKFTGQGGNLEETVTRNNLEAAEEIVRQLRLRDAGGIIVIDFIDMVLESNRELVLRRLLECLARDRTKHQVAEVTSLGLVQMTRKRVGSGLLESFSRPCDCCNGRGVLVSLDGDGASEAASQSSTGQSSNGVASSGSSNGTAGKGGEDEADGHGSNGVSPAAATAPPQPSGRRRRRAATREPGPPDTSADTLPAEAPSQAPAAAGV